ncbi:hypothetical protein [Kitasatospora sp. NPDC088346]|uniref:hypothetical protein n=1 Tax=Kitasatospora sp. NPDC088346 TaxID=3364073 RepID=UPI00382F7148
MTTPVTGLVGDGGQQGGQRGARAEPGQRDHQRQAGRCPRRLHPGPDPSRRLPGGDHQPLRRHRARHAGPIARWPEIESTADSTVIRYPAVDVRAHGHVLLDPVTVIADQRHTTALATHWSARPPTSTAGRRTPRPSSPRLSSSTWTS